MYNPKLLNIIDHTLVAEQEGCLSFPQLVLNKKRPKQISVEYQNEMGELNKAELFDYYARGFLHELDHLNGVVFIDNMSPLVLKMARKRRHKRQKN
jgi:peptide deformylase